LFCRSAGSLFLGLKQPVEGGSKETEIETSSDQTVCSSFPQDISVVGLVFNDPTNENSVHVICNHVGPSMFEDSVDSIVEIEHSAQLSDSGRQHSQTEAQMFMVEESLGNCNECREQVFESIVASHSESMSSNEEYMDPPNLNIPEAVELNNVGMYHEESSSKFNEFRERISGNNVTLQTGNAASDQEDTNSSHLNIPESVKFNEVKTDAVLPSADDSQDR
jgi:hypothetical protein